MNTVTVPSHCEITIRRPNGQIETITHPKVKAMCPSVFQAMKTATAKAGRGECLSYKNFEKEVDGPEKNEVDLVCDHQDRMEKIMREQG